LKAMTMSAIEQGKRAAAEAAVAEVEAGMLVGLGTGSTAAFAIQALARRVREGLAVRAVATSLATAEAASAAGIQVLDFADIAAVDLCIDGVDEIDPALRAIKGAGGAMLREKIVATAAIRMIAIADESKAVDRIGAHPVPVEFLPFARSFVERRLTELGATPVLRMAGDTPYHTDQGHPVFDARFGDLADPAALAAALSACPGVLAHGLFLTEIDTVYFGFATGVIRRDREF
jgi:ribose 5-phosphate isomerase A